MKIISFSGVDGSGKSTQTKLLQKHFEGQGLKVAYFHATEFSFVNRLSRKKSGVKNFTPGDTKAVTQANFIGTLARLFFLFIDSLRFAHYQKKLRKSGTEVIVSDRFFQDSLMNVAFLSHNFLIYFGIKLVAWFAPVPHQSFYLKLTAEDIASRERVPEQGMDYLEKKIAIYDYPPFSWSTQVIDATQTPEIIHQEVVGFLTLS